MKRLLRHTVVVFTVCSLSLASGMVVFAAQDAVSSLSLDTAVVTSRTQERGAETVNRKEQAQSAQEANRSTRSFFAAWFLQPFRSSSGNNIQSDKLLSNVKVLPNPSGETLSVSFRLGKRAEVSIKIMDALGNELTTLFNQTLDSGIQNHSLEIQQKLSPGFYFVRVSTGSETVVKRISIL